MLLISVYMPCRGLRENVDESQECLAQLREVILKYTDTHMILLGGDFNEDLYSQKDSVRLNSFKTFIEEYTLTTQQTGKTYINNEGVDRTIDCIFVCKVIEISPRIARLDDVHSSVSDHYPGGCTIHSGISESTKAVVTFPLPSKVRWEKVDKEPYAEIDSHQIKRVKTEFSFHGSYGQ